MATGTGKTYTAFQIIWRLWKARRQADAVPRRPQHPRRPDDPERLPAVRRRDDEAQPEPRRRRRAGSTRPTRSTSASTRRSRAREDKEPIYDEFSPDFFDLIVIDECHRGSAAEDSAWREILDYFDSATQIGMTATPKETKYVSNIDYFGEPVYTYSLSRASRTASSRPTRWSASTSTTTWSAGGPRRARRRRRRADRGPHLQPDGLRPRHRVPRARRSSSPSGSPSSCTAPTDAQDHRVLPDIDHAERMRQALVNVERGRWSQADHRYVMRITGDNDEGKAQLDNFIDPKRPYPVIATTSKLMTTGVDAQTCHLIVLDQRIQSLTEFKQIIGRGTRSTTDYGKYFFTIIDFRKATELFADPDFDGPRPDLRGPEGDERRHPAGSDARGRADRRRDRRDPRRPRSHLRRCRRGRATTGTCTS